MALKGTLKDFGIADILQLIGQQQKNGSLHLKDKEQQVTISFKDGNIVRAESTTRNKRDLIGTMLVQAALITERQLEFALDTQRRTLQRLGDVLVAQGAITAEKFKRMVQLQTTETLYKLFSWKAGSYEFEQGEVEIDPSFSALRAESVLMEGFRMVDEWPVVRKRLSSYAITFERLKELPPPPPNADSFDDALDDAFGEEKKEVSKGEFQSIGENERRVFEQVKSGRTVRTIIDLACVGEFETCKALVNLINLEYLRALAPEGKDEAKDAIGGAFTERVSGVVGRAVLAVVVLLGLFLLGTRVDLSSVRLGQASATSYADPATQRFISQQQLSRISAAIDVYRLEHGEAPVRLEALVESGLLAKDDLRYPWADNYFYRRTDRAAFVLLPPLR